MGQFLTTDFPLRKHLQRFRKCFALGCEDSRSERVGRIARQDRDFVLQHDWAMVVLIVHKMDRATAFTLARRQDRLVNVMAVHPMPAEFWN